MTTVGEPRARPRGAEPRPHDKQRGGPASAASAMARCLLKYRGALKYRAAEIGRKICEH